MSNYRTAIGRVVTALTLGEEPSDNDLLIAKRTGVDLPLIREYLKHVKQVTDVPAK